MAKTEGFGQKTAARSAAVFIKDAVSPCSCNNDVIMTGLQSYLIVAENLEQAPLSEELKTPSTDVFHLLKDQLGVDDARRIIEQSYKRPVSGSENSVVVFTSKLTIEAQNALLKVFEEPPSSTALYLIVPHESVLIGTLRSRFITMMVAESDKDNALATDFLHAGYKERLDMIAAKAKAKDSLWMENLVKVIGSLYQTKKDKTKTELQALALVESFVRIRGASRKQLLEELALSLKIEK